jgi:hypothetical protein
MIGALLFTIPIALTAGLAGGFISRLLSPARQPNGEPGVIKATNLALVDERGRERAVLALIRGRPMLVLSDEYTLPTGDTILRARVAIGILDDGAPGLELADANGKKRALVSVKANGSSIMELTVKNSNARATLSAPADGNAFFEFSDRAGNQVARWP